MGFSFRTMVDQQIIDCNAPFSEMPLKRDKIAPLKIINYTTFDRMC